MTNRCLKFIIKDQDPVILGSETTVQHACERMWKRRVGAVLVVDAEQLEGIFTGRDAVHALAKGLNPVVTTLSTAMTGTPDTITPDATAIDALRKMSDCGFRHLPIVDGGKVIGIVSRSDFKGLELDRLEDETSLWERVC